MAIEGPLRELGIHDVFQLLDLSRKTGVLRVMSDVRHNQGTVYFEGGAVRYAEIRSNPHPLGEVLLRAGKIGEADLSRARDMQRGGDGRRLGQILVAIGAVTDRELERQVRLQIEEVVFEVMGWREGHFSFAEQPLAEIPAEATTSISTESLLMEGARRIDEWSRIQSKIPHVGVVPHLAPTDGGGVGQVDLLPSEWELLATVDGSRDVRTIAGALGLSEFDVAKTVFGLACTGIVELVDPGRASGALQAAAVRDLDDVLRRAERAIAAGDLEGARALAEGARAAHPTAADVHLLLGRLAVTARWAAEAEEHLRRALRLDALLTDAHRLLGDAVAAQGRFGEAIEWWERWLTHGEHAAHAPDDVRRVEESIRAARTLAGHLGGVHV